MMDKEFQEKILQSIKECRWRKDMFGIDICTGNVLPCVRVIGKGDCELIKQKFADAPTIEPEDK